MRGRGRFLVSYKFVGAFITHNPVNPLVLDPLVPFQTQAGPDTEVTVGGTVLDVLLFLWLRNTDGPVFQGANSTSTSQQRCAAPG